MTETMRLALISSLILALAMGLFHEPVHSQESLSEYKEAVSRQLTHFKLVGDQQIEVCARAITWYVDYNDEHFLKDLGGSEMLRAALSGKCLDRQSEFQIPIKGRPDQLASIYLLTMSLTSDGEILVLLDAIEAMGERNSKIMAYHLRTGRLRPELLTRNDPDVLASSRQEIPAEMNAEELYERGMRHAERGDEHEAAKWLRLAADRGYALAQNFLGRLNNEGYEGVPKDKQEAVRLFRLAAEQGLPEAQYNLGLMYHRGTGVARDYVTAYAWFSVAARGGFGWSAETDARVAYGLLSSEERETADELLAKLWERHGRTGG